MRFLATFSCFLLCPMFAFALDCRTGLSGPSIEIVAANVVDGLRESQKVQNSILLKNHGSFELGFYLNLEPVGFLRHVLQNKQSILARIGGRIAGYFLFHEIQDLSQLNPTHGLRIRALQEKHGLDQSKGIYAAGIAVEREFNLKIKGIGGRLYSSAVEKLKKDSKTYMVLEIALNPMNSHSLQFFLNRGARKIDSYKNEQGVEWGIFIVEF